MPGGNRFATTIQFMGLVRAPWTRLLASSARDQMMGMAADRNACRVRLAPVDRVTMNDTQLPQMACHACINRRLPRLFRKNCETLFTARVRTNPRPSLRDDSRARASEERLARRIPDGDQPE